MLYLAHLSAQERFTDPSRYADVSGKAKCSVASPPSRRRAADNTHGGREVISPGGRPWQAPVDQDGRGPLIHIFSQMELEDGVRNVRADTTDAFLRLVRAKFFIERQFLSILAAVSRSRLECRAGL